MLSVLRPPGFQDAVALAETLLYEDAEVEVLPVEGRLNGLGVLRFRAFLGWGFEDLRVFRVLGV